MRKLSIAIILIVVLSLSACVGVAKEKTIKIEPIDGIVTDEVGNVLYGYKLDVRWYDNGKESFMVWARVKNIIDEGFWARAYYRVLDADGREIGHYNKSLGYLDAGEDDLFTLSSSNKGWEEAKKPLKVKIWVEEEPWLWCLCLPC